MNKTAEELTKEAEELQKQFAPDLYEGEEEGTSDDKGASDEKSAANDKSASDDEGTETEEEKKAREDAEAEAKKPVEIDYKAEAERLTAEIHKLNDYESSARGRLQGIAEENRILKEELEVLKQRITDLETSGTGEDDKAKEKLLLKLTDKYGEDFVDDMDAYLAWKEKRDNGGKAKVGVVQPKPASDSTEDALYINSLTNAVPDWNEIVKEPKFAEFLSETDSFTGESRYNLMRKAHELKDAQRVAAFYNTFKKSISADSKNTPPAKKDRTDRLAPSSTAKGQIDKPLTETYTADQIKQLKDKIFELKSTGKAKEAERLQMKIDTYLDSLSFG